MAQPMSFFVPHPLASAAGPCAGPLAIAFQEPKTAPDTPAGTGLPGVQGGDGKTQVPGGPGGPQGTPPQPCGLGDSNMFLFMGLGLAAMYFLVMRPEQKRRKQQQDMLAAIKVGDHVVTLGGMHGVVAQMTEKTVTVRVDTAKMTFDRSAIARIERDEASSGESKKV